MYKPKEKIKYIEHSELVAKKDIVLYRYDGGKWFSYKVKISPNEE